MKTTDAVLFTKCLKATLNEHDELFNGFLFEIELFRLTYDELGFEA